MTKLQSDGLAVSQTITLEEMSTRALARDASRPAIEFNKRWFTWGELSRAAGSMNRLIDASGADAGSHIAFVPRNHPSGFAALIGLTSRGRNIRMIHAYQSPAGIARDILRRKPAAVVAGAEDFTDEVQTALQTAGIAGIALTDMDAVAVPGCERSTADCEPPPARTQIEMLTSGTTGPPKLFAFTYELISEHFVGANTVISADGQNAAEQAPMFLFFPLGNISGIYSNLPVLLHGIRAVLVDRFTLAAWHEFVLRYRPEWVGVPAAAIQMILDADIPPADLASLRVIAPGAAPVDPAVQRQFEERYDIAILTAYGATEFGGPVTRMSPELYAEWGKEKLGSVGRPFGGADIRIVDPETGVVLAPGQEGIIEVMTPRIGSQWLHTADLGVIDEDGFLFVRGRADGAIIRGGFKLLPETIESALLRHGGISAVSVVGIADRRLGQVPAAAIQLKPGLSELKVEELQEYLRQQVSATHIPVRWRFVKQLPVTGSMKVDRGAVKRLFESGSHS